MIERFVYVLKCMLSMLVLIVGSIVMLVVGLSTGFMLRNFYSEVLVAGLGKLILKIWGVRLVLHQASPLPQGQVVYISNHTSTLDLFVLISLALPRTRFFLSGYLRKIVPMGVIGYLIGVIWTVPQSFPKQRSKIFQRAEYLLRKTGDSVFLSPEGERVTTGEIGLFNKGAFHLATALKLPIVPLYIQIPKAIDPGKGLHARPGCVHVYVKPSIQTVAWHLDDLLKNKEEIRERYVQWHAQHKCS